MTNSTVPVPAIGCLQITLTLLDQYQRVLASMADAKPDAFSCAVAELCRIYPAIWEHLDIAAEHLRARGEDLSDYDRIRAQAGDTSAALSEYERTGGVDRMALLRGKLVVSDTVRFRGNDAGIERARQAHAALAVLIPSYDPEADDALAAWGDVDLSRGPAAIARPLLTAVALFGVSLAVGLLLGG